MIHPMGEFWATTFHLLLDRYRSTPGIKMSPVAR